MSKCPNCGEKSTNYCVDCKTPLCRFCVVLLHHPGTKKEKHSIEDIEDKQGVKIVTPIILDIMVVFIFTLLISGQGLSLQFFDGHSYCPFVSKGRKWVAQTDANVFFYYKGSIAQYCDWEDSYWRFFVDAWIRGILTNTDGLLLLFSQFVRAVIFEEFFRFFLAPVVAIAYGIVAGIVSAIEYWLTRTFFQKSVRAQNFIGGLEFVINKISFFQNLPIKDKVPPPPLTRRRKRPAENCWESMNYWIGRQTRTVSYYRAQAMAAFSFTLQKTLQAVVVLRVVCIIFGNSYALQVVEWVGLGEIRAKHVSWFSESTGWDEQQLHQGVFLSDFQYSDWLVTRMFTQVGHQLPLVRLLFTDLGAFLAAITKSSVTPASAKFVKSWLLIPLLAVLLPYGLCKWYLAKQSQNFAKTWKKKTGQEIWGNAEKTITRADTQQFWPNLKFSPPRTTGKASAGGS